jgi:excisionase family DNA binding protein
MEQLNSEEFLSTGQAAKMLGLTISTVQKMTETGVLSSYTTPGGHRRILSSSFNEFCDKLSLKETKYTKENSLVFIMHHQAITNNEIATIAEFPNVKVICSPLDLLGLQRSNITVFMDARLPWIDEKIFQTNTELGNKTQVYLYNSEALPSTSSIKIHPNVTAIEGDINRDLIFGFLLKKNS